MALARIEKTLAKRRSARRELRTPCDTMNLPRPNLMRILWQEETSMPAHLPYEGLSYTLVSKRLIRNQSDNEGLRPN